MTKLGLLLCLVGLAIAGPPVTKSRKDIEAFREYLEKSRTGDGTLFSSRMIANPRAKAWENSGKFEGDILLDDSQVEDLVESYATGKSAFIRANTKWPGNTVVYEIAPGFNAQQQQAIWNSIVDIQRNTCIRFRLRRAGEANFVRITGREDGCYAHVGYSATRGVHTMNLARWCFVHTIIVHEWLHIVGFVHMHSTYNRYDYLRVHWENIWPGTAYAFTRYGTNVVHNMGLPYEYTSVMHYDAFAFTVNNRPTLSATRSFSGTMGQRSFITWFDWLRARRHYNCPGAWTESIPIDPTIDLLEETAKDIDTMPEAENKV